MAIHISDNVVQTITIHTWI